jgi:hypothetical protein
VPYFYRKKVDFSCGTSVLKQLHIFPLVFQTLIKTLEMYHLNIILKYGLNYKVTQYEHYFI